MIDAYTGWCGPCKAVQPLFKKLKIDTADDMLHFAMVPPPPTTFLRHHTHKHTQTYTHAHTNTQTYTYTHSSNLSLM